MLLAGASSPARHTDCTPLSRDSDIAHAYGACHLLCLWEVHFVVRTEYTAQVRRKADNENLAEWIVDITTEADRQGSDKFVEIYKT